MSKQLEVNFKGHPYPIDCLHWSNDHLALCASKCARLIHIASSSALTRPIEIEPLAADLANIVHSGGSKVRDAHGELTIDDDVTSFAESATDIHVVEVVYSPYGVGKLRQPCVAILTAAHRVGIYGPTKDPDKDVWALLHVLDTERVEEPYHKGTHIRKLRVSTMDWTPAIPVPGNHWGASFLVCGNEAGQVVYYSVSVDSQSAVYIQDCSEYKIKRMKHHIWKDNSLRSVIADEFGTIFLSELHVEMEGLTLRPSHLTSSKVLLPGNGSKCHNLAIYESDAGCSIAAAFSGRIEIAYITGQSTRTQRYFLPFSAALTGLAWYANPDTTLTLIVLGMCGQSIALLCDRHRESITIDERLDQIMQEFARKQLMVCAQTAPATESHQIRYYGLAISTGGMFGAISYAFSPINRIRYLISATEFSRISTFQISPNLEQVLQNLLIAFITNPYRTSIAELSAIHRRANQSLSTTLANYEEHTVASSNTGHDLASRLFLNCDLNILRVQLLAADIDSMKADHLMQRLQTNWFSEILVTIERDDLHADEQIAKVLLRISDYIALHDRANRKLMELVKTSYSKLKAVGQNTGDESLHFNEESTPEHYPARDSCPACQAPIFMSDNKIATCTNLHVWQRCSITLAILASPKCLTCLQCSRKIISHAEKGDTPLGRLLEAFDICYWCTGKYF